jgi:hypothetical protein
LSYSENLGGRQGGRVFGIIVVLAIVGIILLAGALGN